MSSTKRFLATATLVIAVAAASASLASSAPSRSPAMHEFAFIFRPTRAVDPATLPQRNAAAREWALARRSEGTLLSGHPLEETGAVVTQAAVTPLASEHPVAAILVVQFASLDAAVALAKTHPGLAYGTEIEVRPVKAVTLPPR